MTSKDCGSHHSDSSPRKIFRRVILPIIIILFIILLVILFIWAILQPSKPRFILQDATVFNFNVSGNPPDLLSSNFQVTLSSRNPNDKIGIYYDRLDVYASYGSQQITFATSIPSTYQGHKEVNVWSPFIGGSSVPVAPYNALSLAEDQTRGAIMLLIRLNGRVRWKVGAFITGTYHLHVRCPAYINFGNSAAGVIVGYNAVKYTLVTTCSVSF
ncbi:NDR1/HIN1-like protein 1 [Cardamine amara subsp. amara]|uniref:NDR1/HIN1-like protein 1 n=1 Tax=Cardamine amara subsp. amara TaxID=228776 RepID=A0ABD0ZQQ6_CARAN